MSMYRAVMPMLITPSQKNPAAGAMGMYVKNRAWVTAAPAASRATQGGAAYRLAQAT